MGCQKKSDLRTEVHATSLVVSRGGGKQKVLAVLLTIFYHQTAHPSVSCNSGEAE